MSSRFQIETSDGTFDIQIKREHLVERFDTHNETIVLLGLTTWMSLLSDSPLSMKPKLVYYSFRKTIAKTKLVDLVSWYANLGHRLSRSNVIDDNLGTQTGEFIHEFKDTPVFKEYLQFYRTKAPHLLQYLLTFCFFLKKLDYKDTELEANALRAWHEVETKLQTKTFGDLDDLRMIVRSIVPDLSDTPFIPKFGTGAVSEKSVRGVGPKDEILGLTPRLRYWLGYKARNTKYPESYLHFTTLGEDSSVGHMSRARLMMVRKDLRKSRSICMEPNSHMWTQQHVRVGFEDSMHSHLLKGFVNIKDQTRNQRLAEFGSQTSWVDTIDLSSASDSVHIDLVRKVFPRSVLISLLGTRSTSIDMPDGSVYHPSKFAPMGSALCFPVQTTIFAAIVIYAYMLYVSTSGFSRMHRRGELKKFLLGPELFLRKYVGRTLGHQPSKLHTFTVYGDDIICDTRVTDVVISILTYLGFSVNTDKSFIGNVSCRESCGKYYFDGEDVTPVYFTVSSHQRMISPTTYQSLVGMINKLGDAGFRLSRSLLINYLRSHPSLKERFGKKGLGFTSNRDDTSLIYTTNLVPSSMKVRYNRHLQRDEARVVQVRIKDKRPHSAESYLYQTWMRTVYLRDDKPQFSDQGFARYDPIDSRFSMGWTPLR